MPSSSNPTWTVPGKQWSVEIGACRRTLIERLEANDKLAIADLFKMLPLNPTDQQSVDDMIGRGDLMFSAGKVSNTSGDTTRASFLDDNVGSVRLVVPDAIVARATTDKVAIEFEAESGEILIILSDLPSQYPFSGNFVLRKLTLSERAVVYSIQDQIAPNGWFHINVDLTIDPTPFVALAALRAMPAHRRRKVAIIVKAMSSEEDSCFGQDDGSPSWFITRDGMGLCRIQHGNEHVLGTKIYGPATLEQCQAKLLELQANGQCA